VQWAATDSLEGILFKCQVTISRFSKFALNASLASVGAIPMALKIDLHFPIFVIRLI
jgi:hypothetical protein